MYFLQFYYKTHKSAANTLHDIFYISVCIIFRDNSQLKTTLDGYDNSTEINSIRAQRGSHGKKKHSTLVLLGPHNKLQTKYNTTEMDKIICERCPVNQSVKFWKCGFLIIYRNMFPLFKGWKCVSNSSFKWMGNKKNHSARQGCLLITTKVVFNPFYKQINSLLLGIKWL